MSFQNILNSLDDAQTSIQMSLENGKNVHKSIGQSLSSEYFDEIQEWHSKIADLACDTRSLIESMQRLAYDQHFGKKIDRIHIDINKLLDRLAVTCFVVEQQPAQVLKKDTR